MQEKDRMSSKVWDYSYGVESLSIVQKLQLRINEHDGPVFFKLHRGWEGNMLMLLKDA